ncbi:MAG: hypothetical protein AMXMBFR82_35090 [Candidatus Hydrogenedentota bacterium]
MTLFKSKALPVVIEDIATSLDRASNNATTALSLLHAFVRIDPSNLDLDSFLTDLSRDVFRLREDCYPPPNATNAVTSLGNVETTKAGYWPVYAYLFALLPVLVERPRVGGTRWTADEYRQLKIACLNRWADAHDDSDNVSIMDGYNRMLAAEQSWFKRTEKLAAASEWCLTTAVDQIERSFPRQDGAVRTKGFRYAIEEFVSSLYSAFRSDLAEYWMGVGSFGFLASDPAPLPSHFDRE